MVTSSAFWKNKKVLLTGHTGFKGSWLALWLQKLDAQLVGYSLPAPTEPSLYDHAGVGKHMRSVLGDIRDNNLLSDTISNHRPEIIFHMAAQSLVLPSYADPVTTYATNVIGTVNLLDSVRRCDSVRVVINVTSDKCYENRGDGHDFVETDPMGGSDPYSSSKACAELVTTAYRRSFFTESRNGAPVAIATVRAGNVIGGGDWSPHRLVPDIMRAFIANKTPVIRSPEATRPWQHVLEPLNGYLLLAERMWQQKNEYAQAWNFGPDEKDIRPVSWLVDELVKLWGEKAAWQRDTGTHPAEAVSLRLDCSKVKSQLGWSPRVPLSTALAWTVEWFKTYASGGDIRSITETQINRYQNIGNA